ncbi:hypothetical protein DAPPUDRAFT_329459 [Daphnia pulex]|uniref:Uncharacterized protein n=1 Tax=Daphnia pulex TaxID=6669 RepID=E9HGN4_DAPPU|nr:hypothetical protein DAPPUDRAFT_329459 [Daphnia pulex]|eukprot:EFX69117.1 hypothetical protein DAPPUDRAFT_329459 [Daphnia pulex]
MRGFGLLAIISCVWILLVLLLSVEAVPLASKTGEDSGMPTEPEKMVNKTSSVYDYVTPEVMSTVVGAALGDQDCLRYSACKAGNYVADVTGKEIVLMVLDRWVPNSWQGTLRAFKEAATYKDDCKKQFPCSNPQQE